MTGLFYLEFVDCEDDIPMESFLAHVIVQDCRLFGIQMLSQQIPVLVLKRADFQKRLAATSLEAMGAGNCIAFSDSGIYALSYSELSKKMSRSGYLRAIRHELIHVLQHLASRVPPHEMIWLYESLACVIAKQRQKLPISTSDWFRFVTNFYAIPDCYAVAYNFGKALLDAYTLRDLMTLSKNKGKCLQVSHEIYQGLFNDDGMSAYKA